MSEHAQAFFWLTVRGERYGSKYRLNTPRTTKNKPNIRKDEVAIQVTLKLPNALFERPALTAEISVDPEQVGAPVISANVINNIVELARVEGIELTITAPSEEE